MECFKGRDSTIEDLTLHFFHFGRVVDKKAKYLACFTSRNSCTLYRGSLARALLIFAVSI